MSIVALESLHNSKPVSLVTGAAGFLGSHLVDRLLLEGHMVIGVDNLCSGKRKNLEQASRYGDEFIFVLADVSSELELPPVKIDYIWHLASPASPVDYRRLSYETMLVNSFGTKVMLDLAAQNKARFLLASTSESYGDPQVHPQTETYWGNVNPVGERSCYDESKRFAEALTFEYRRRFSLDARIIRIFNTYGPRMQITDGRVVPNFIYQALSGKPLTVYGDGSQTRSFVYVADEIEGIYRAMLYDHTDGEVINLGNPDEYRIIQFAEIVTRLCGVKLQTVYKPLPLDDPSKRCPNITKAIKILNWQPRTNLTEGLMLTIDYFQNQLMSSVTEHKIMGAS